MLVPRAVLAAPVRTASLALKIQSEMVDLLIGGRSPCINHLTDLQAILLVREADLETEAIALSRRGSLFKKALGDGTRAYQYYRAAFRWARLEAAHRRPTAATVRIAWLLGGCLGAITGQLHAPKWSGKESFLPDSFKEFNVVHAVPTLWRLLHNPRRLAESAWPRQFNLEAWYREASQVRPGRGKKAALF